MTFEMKIEDSFMLRPNVMLVSGMVPSDFATDNAGAARNIGSHAWVRLMSGERRQFRVLDVTTSLSLANQRSLTVGLATNDAGIDLNGGILSAT